MDIGNQQRVIIVEPDEVIPKGSVIPTEAEITEEPEFEQAMAWPLPLDLDPEPARVT